MRDALLDDSIARMSGPYPLDGYAIDELIKRTSPMGGCAERAREIRLLLQGLVGSVKAVVPAETLPDDPIGLARATRQQRAHLTWRRLLTERLLTGGWRNMVTVRRRRGRLA